MKISFSLEIHASKEKVWMFYEDINRWYEWEANLEAISLDGAFKTGTVGKMKLVNMPEMVIEMTSVKEMEEFVDVSKTPMGTVSFGHFIKETDEGVLLTHSVSIPSNEKEKCDFLLTIFSDVPQTMFKLKEVVEREL